MKIVIGRWKRALLILALSGSQGSSQYKESDRAIVAARCKVEKRETGVVVNREVLACDVNANVEVLKTVCRERVDKLSTTNASKFVDVIVSSSIAELGKSVLARIVPSREFGAGFDRTIEAIGKLGPSPMNMKAPIVRCTAVDGAIKISVAETKGDSLLMPVVTSNIFGGRDPQRIRVGSGEIELLWIEEVSASVMAARFMHISAIADVDVTCDVCKKAMDRIIDGRQNMFTRAVLRIRADPWFDGDAFPLIYRFHSLGGKRLLPGPIVGVPNVEDYYGRSREVRCSISKGREGGSCAYLGLWTEAQLPKGRGLE